jgi:hypothetical protein
VVKVKKYAILICGFVLIFSTFILLNPISAVDSDFENTIITSPENNDEVSGSVTITVEVMACYCNGTVKLYIDDEYISEVTRDCMSKDGKYEIYTYDWDSTTVIDGTYTIKAVGKHDEHTDEIEVAVKNGGSGGEPEIVRIISPEDNSEVKGDVTITTEVLACDCNGITSLYVDGEFVADGTPGKMTTDGAYEIFIHVWDSREAKDGLHRLTVYGKHNEHSDEIDVIVSNQGGKTEPDIVRIISPEDNAEVKNTVVIKAEVPACFCLSTTSLYVDGGKIADGTHQGMSDDGDYEIFSHEWDTTSAKNGGHKITVFGKHGEHSDSITVFVSNDGGGVPEKDIRFVPFEENKILTGKITIKVEVKSSEDTGPTLLYINDEFVSEGYHIDDIEYEGETYSIYQHEWDSTKVENGMYTLKIQDSNKEQFDAIQLEVNNEAVGINDHQSDVEKDQKGILMLSGLIGVIGITLILLIALKRRAK